MRALPREHDRRPDVTRAEIVRLARLWCGTPYHHQASELGIGTDCLGLVRGVWRSLYGREAQELPPYTRDWAEAGEGETLIEAARRHMVEIDRGTAQPGDLLLFRMRASAPAKHAAILATVATMVHAAEGAPAAETPLSPWWRRRIAAAFAFPGRTD
jgi:NlpC/P60 family putative phage cell wall peptidase